MQDYFLAQNWALPNGYGSTLIRCFLLLVVGFILARHFSVRYLAKPSSDESETPLILVCAILFVASLSLFLIFPWKGLKPGDFNGALLMSIIAFGATFCFNTGANLVIRKVAKVRK